MQETKTDMEHTKKPKRRFEEFSRGELRAKCTKYKLKRRLIKQYLSEIDHQHLLEFIRKKALDTEYEQDASGALHSWIKSWTWVSLVCWNKSDEEGYNNDEGYEWRIFSSILDIDFSFHLCDLNNTGGEEFTMTLRTPERTDRIDCETGSRLKGALPVGPLLDFTSAQFILKMIFLAIGDFLSQEEHDFKMIDMSIPDWLKIKQSEKT